jgi:hypothetical protein
MLFGDRHRPVDIAAGIDERAAQRQGVPEQCAILLQRGHRDDHGLQRRFGSIGYAP